MIYYRFDNGDTIERLEKSLIVRLNGQRRVLSTSALNGGLRDDLASVFNQDCKENGRKDAPLSAPTYEEHLKLVAAGLGLDPASSSGLTTAADMENVTIAAETYHDLTVTAAVTGGIDVNGGRAGDPASWHEAGGVSVPAGGTINILLFISARLTEGAISRALVTCTEAKTAALQELMAPSLFSSGLATGSGTDGTVIVSDLESPLLLTYAGKHAKLGELIGKTVIRAMKEALFRQTGLSPSQQFDIFSRIGRYGITREHILSKSPGPDPDRLEQLARQSGLVVATSLYVHLLDQLSWGLLTAEDAVPAANRLLTDMGFNVRVPAGQTDAATAAGALLTAFRRGLAEKASLS